ncbi:outer membrane beta-barrel protein [Shewanella acanthi]|uniref:outer membrane beta-barrel protein n=1 Tax=Shewanella acanthi TaxID=2864212 RepID=UPI001C662519|nr:outer membrane beta-barrel protein [Shewanella acanthi]QYJ78131.1 porin family protein [Shewanella acanthi]
MKNANRLLALVSLLPAVLAFSSHAESEVFVAPFGGYSFGGNSFDLNELDDSQVETGNKKGISIEEGEHYGLMVGLSTNDPGNIYLMFSRQSSELRSGGLDSPDLLTNLDVDYIHLGGTLYFPRGDFRPYVTATAGVTRLMAQGWSTETRFSMGLGVGAEYRLASNLSLFGDIRGNATFINSDSALFCNANTCLWHITSDLMWQAQANLGLKLSF